MFCSHCGTPSENKRFCTNCGAELSRHQAPTVPATEAEGIQPFVHAPQGQSSAALTGQTLDQKYYLESKLGAGGMGTIYRARRLMIGDTVAVKVIHPDQMTNPRAAERFRREAQTAARLKHPNVVTVYDFGVSKEGLSYLVMELAEGDSLRQLIDRQGILTETVVAEIVSQIGSAIDEAHQHGVVHRDIKPENILVQTSSSGMRVKVLDFGIAALLDITANRLTQTGGIIGTPHYMSPEQCLGEELDGRSDIYGLGVVLFEMLTGVVPFNSPTPTAIVIQQVNQSPPPLRNLNAKISPAVEAVVLHALEKQREARPQTAGELARDLITAINDSGVASFSPAMVNPAAGIRPATTLSPSEITTSASNRYATQLDTPPIFDSATARGGSNSKIVLLFFAAFLLLAGVIGGGIWWYLQKGKTNQVATTTDSTNSNQQNGAVAKPENDQASVTGKDPHGDESTPKPTITNGNLWEVIAGQTSGATDAANALGAADKQMASIKPGGQLALAYREGQFFGDGQGADIRVNGPRQQRVSYLIFVRDDPAGDWQRIDINRGGFSQGEAGHDMGHHGIRQARQVMIRNNGNADLSIDAITVVYKNKVSGASGTHRHH